MVCVFIRYKGFKKEELTIKIPSHGTSQECSRCGHTHPVIGKLRLEFICQNCGFTASADYNADLVIKKRGIKAWLDGTIVVNQKKSVRVRKGPPSQKGQGLPKSRRVSMDVGNIMDGPFVFGQEATVRRNVGIPQCASVCDSRSPHLNHFLRLGVGWFTR